MSARMLLKYLPSTRFFENGMMRFSQPGALNDPNEARPQLSFGKYASEDYAEASRKANEAGIHNLPKDRLEAFFLVPFPRRRYDEKSFPGLWPAMEPRLRAEPFHTLDEFDECVARKAIELCRNFVDQNLGILSLSETNDEPMWAHYAANHTGIAIRFRRDHSFFATEVQQVDYSESPIFVSSNDGWVRVGGIAIKNDDILNSKVDHAPRSLLLRKRTAWQYEKECRLISPLSKASRIIGPDSLGYPICLFEIPDDAIDSVVFGHRANDSTIARVRNAIHENNAWSYIKLWKRMDTMTGMIETPL